MDQLLKRLNELIKKSNLDSKRGKLTGLQEQANQPNFWSNEERARKVSQELADIQKEVSDITALQKQIGELKSLEGDKSLSVEIEKEKKKISKQLDKLETKSYLSGPYDRLDAILSVHSGQGGVDAMDWAAMLFRMYSKYAEKKDWKIKHVSESLGEEAGIKSATIIIKGSFAYGLLKGEVGTHRLVRLSPYNADSLRQTSFALVEVLPLIEGEASTTVKDEDIEFHAFRSGGKGGQNVNKVSTAVRLKHIPSGIIVESQAERSQIQNRKIALNLIKAKLWQIEEKKRQKQMKEIKGAHKLAGWGNQIRSYVLHPYKQVKDLRTRVESKDPDKVLAGDLDIFINAELGL